MVIAHTPTISTKTSAVGPGQARAMTPTARSARASSRRLATGPALTLLNARAACRPTAMDAYTANKMSDQQALARIDGIGVIARARQPTPDQRLVRRQPQPGAGAGHRRTHPAEGDRRRLLPGNPPEQLFRECSVYCELVSIPDQLPRVLEMAMRAALAPRIAA